MARAADAGRVGRHGLEIVMALAQDARPVRQRSWPAAQVSCGEPLLVLALQLVVRSGPIPRDGEPHL
ncbi:hypothetical protein AB0F03_33120 [Streptomyces sp. NPDC028722]|uniref:hypothetical protein n=1 Tax=unclassified Streptomyces TaxID=2593676 RepID=UPI0033F7D81B